MGGRGRGERERDSVLIKQGERETEEVAEPLSLPSAHR